MKFWCGSSKQRKLSNKSLSSSDSNNTLSSVPIQKSDSGFSETGSSIQNYSVIEQILVHERTYHENLKKFIIKYSRPLRRYLSSDEIVELFQNIEKIFTITESILRQSDRLNNLNETSISTLYQSSLFGVMYNSYHIYLSQNLKAQTRLKQYENKISYLLQMSVNVIREEIMDFLLCPIRHICSLYDLFQNFSIEYPNLMNAIDYQIVENMKILSEQADTILQISIDDEISQDNTIQSVVSPVIVLQRTDKEPWELKRIELFDSKIILTKTNRVSTVYLSNVVHIEKNYSNGEIRLFVASSSTSHSAVKIIRVDIRFHEKNQCFAWSKYLYQAVQQAKDRNWKKTNELII